MSIRFRRHGNSKDWSMGESLLSSCVTGRGRYADFFLSFAAGLDFSGDFVSAVLVSVFFSVVLLPVLAFVSLSLAFL